MRIAFLQNEWVDHYGIMCLSNILKNAGHIVDVFIEKAHCKFIKAVVNFNPDIIGFRTVTYNHQWVLKTADILKQHLNLPIIVGGVHATLCPDIIDYPQIDIVCRGEGEYPILELLNSMQEGLDYSSIANLWVKQNKTIFKNEIRSLEENLDNLYPPDRSLYMDKYDFFKKYPWKNIMAGRGCPYSCSYCYNNALKELFSEKGKYVRWRSPENIIKEIKLLVNQYNAKILHFSDDIFAMDIPWFYDFLEAYRNCIKLPFICNARADLINEKIADELQKSGCHCVFFGIETGNEKLRSKLLNKKITNQQIIKTAQILHSKNLLFLTNNMFGLPGESFKNTMETINLNIQIKTDFPMGYIFQPYPGLDLTKSAREQGYLKDDYEKNKSYFVDNNLCQKDIHKIFNIHKLFYLIVKLPYFSSFFNFLCRFSPNPLFYFIYLLSFVVRYKNSHGVSYLNTIYLAYHEWNIFKRK